MLNLYNLKTQMKAECLGVTSNVMSNILKHANITWFPHRTLHVMIIFDL